MTQSTLAVTEAAKETQLTTQQKNELAEQEKQRQLAAIYQEELLASREGMEIIPTRWKINKDACKFMDPFGTSCDELKGVVVFKQKPKAYFRRGSDSKLPECSSWDGTTGMVLATGELRRCVSCPLNQWGSGTDEAGNQTRGKACKEMRRLFILLGGYHLPILVSLPPTSIRECDQYFSARLAEGKPDIAAETIIALIPQTGGKYAYAKAKFKIGADVPPERLMELRDLRLRVKEAAQAIKIEVDDYMGDEEADSSGNGETDSNEPF